MMIHDRNHIAETSNSNNNTSSTLTNNESKQQQSEEEEEACIFIKAPPSTTSLLQKKKRRISSKIADEITSRSFVDYNILLAATVDDDNTSSFGGWEEEIEKEQEERMMEFARISLVESVCEPSSSSIVEVWHDCENVVTAKKSPSRDNDNDRVQQHGVDHSTTRNNQASSSSVEHLMERISHDITRRVSVMEEEDFLLHPTQIIDFSHEEYDKRSSYTSSAYSSMDGDAEDDDDDADNNGCNDEKDMIKDDNNDIMEKEIPQCTTLVRERSIETHNFRWGSNKILPTKRNSNETSSTITTIATNNTTTTTTHYHIADPSTTATLPQNVVLIDMPFELQALDQQHRASSAFLNVPLDDDNENDGDYIITEEENEEEEEEEEHFDSIRAITTPKRTKKSKRHPKKLKSPATSLSPSRPSLHRHNAAKRGDIHQKNIEQYDGNYNTQGQRHGKNGTLKFPNGDIFEGTFVNGVREGVGTMRYHENKSTYKGGWKDDLYHGYGVRQFQDGYTYYGSYVQGICEGHGQCDFSNGDRYFGNWKQGLMDGHGKYHCANGELYEGMFSRGKREGPGRIHLRNGKLDVIQCVDGVVVGLGVRWSKSRLKAYKLENGVVVGKRISVEEARDIELMIYGDRCIQSTLGSMHVSF